MEYVKEEPKHFVCQTEIATTLIDCHGEWLFLRYIEDGALKGHWLFPGGKVEEGESFEEAARRETFEETGIELGVLEFLEKRYVVQPDLHYRVHLFYAKLDKKPDNIVLDTLEHDAFRWIAPCDFDQYKIHPNHKKQLLNYT